MFLRKLHFPLAYEQTFVYIVGMNTGKPATGFRRRASLLQVAQATGLSISAVSRALNPHPDRNARVAEKTRCRVEAAARRLGFRRNRAAEFMKRGSQATIGVFVPESPNRLVADLIFGVAEIFAEQDFPMQLGFHLKIEGFRRFLQHNIGLSHSGVISYPGLISHPEVEHEVARYRRQGGKMILLNTPLRPKGVPVVAMNEKEGGRLAARHLRDNGCTRFAIVGEYAGRDAAFMEDLGSAGCRAVRFQTNRTGLDNLVRYCGRATAEQPVGVFAVTDLYAMQVLRALANVPGRVGREVLLVGYDDLDLTAETIPPLTTIHQPFREEGRLAARKLINLIYGKDETSVLVSPRLVIRESA